MGSLEDVLHRKRAEEDGMEVLILRWFFRVASEHKESPSQQVVRMMVVPTSSVVLVHKMLKLVIMQETEKNSENKVKGITAEGKTLGHPCLTHSQGGSKISISGLMSLSLSVSNGI